MARLIQFGVGNTGDGVAVVTDRAVSCRYRSTARRQIGLVNPVVIRVYNIEIVGGVTSDPRWLHADGDGRQGSIASVAAYPVSGHGRDDPGSGGDFTDAVIISIRNVNVARIVCGHPGRSVEGRTGSRYAVTVVSVGNSSS